MSKNLIAHNPTWIQSLNPLGAMMPQIDILFLWRMRNVTHYFKIKLYRTICYVFVKESAGKQCFPDLLPKSQFVLWVHLISHLVTYLPQFNLFQMLTFDDIVFVEGFYKDMRHFIGRLVKKGKVTHHDFLLIWNDVGVSRIYSWV